MEWIAVEDDAGVMNPMEPNFIMYPIHQNQLDVKEGWYEPKMGLRETKKGNPLKNLLLSMSAIKKFIKGKTYRPFI